jgi:hypothetical protein
MKNSDKSAGGPLTIGLSYEGSRIEFFKIGALGAKFQKFGLIPLL